MPSFDRLRRCRLEEFVVQLDDYTLTACRILNIADRSAYIIVELLQFLVLLFRLGFVIQQIEHLLHRFRYRIVLCKLVVFEQSFEHRSRNNVLRQHLDSIMFRQVRIDIATQTSHQLLESFAVAVVVGYKLAYAFDMLFGYLGNIACPLLPSSVSCRLS